MGGGGTLGSGTCLKAGVLCVPCIPGSSQTGLHFPLSPEDVGSLTVALFPSSTGSPLTSDLNVT